MDQGLVNSLAAPENTVQQAYQSTAANIQKTQDQHDNDMLKVFEYAGDGQTEAAQYYAKSKNLQIPDEVYANADLSKGLTMAGKLYGKDAAAAHKFTVAWMQNQGVGDLQQRVLASANAAGVPLDPEDRKTKALIDLEKWKLQNVPASQKGGFSLTPGQTRYDAAGQPLASLPARPPVSRFQAGQAAVNADKQSITSTPASAEAARQAAYKEWDASFGAGASASHGLTGELSNPGAGQQQISPSDEASVDEGNADTASIPAGLPVGTSMIGTLNGKPVYQAPNGDKYVDDGNP